MKVELWLKETSQPRIFEDVCTTYTKGPLFVICIRNQNIVYKYPLDTIWRIVEEYVPTAREPGEEVA